MAFTIVSPDFRDSDAIPKRFSCDSENLSPEIQWDGAPPATRSFVLIVEDPDAPSGTFTHWVVYDVPPDLNKLPGGMGNSADIKGGIKQGYTDFGRKGYGGPCPPRGHGVHRYNFILTALDIPGLGLADGAKKSEVERAMKGHVLGTTRMTGRYGR
ncbi:MAG: YbhB/YbcL family Raf kinase inhibitor-like protein [Deltaproteobacteria bacterium]|nr:YbhB/YbcL family Raf kinase inhibitor-like protein [Deltaproteobacteria bacterium]MBI5903394.1 YbhB/YbcL family Raf kinase inhibitor-like protein [Deltaproteobacteria bacterium]